VTIVVVGSRGQLGRALARAPGVVALDRATLDVTGSLTTIRTTLAGYRPRVIINAAAYTAVDRAETDRARAFAVNADGAARIARASADLGARYIYVSTDHVFGAPRDRPHREDDPPTPTNVYGESKADGEVATIAAGGSVVRTAGASCRRS
jgi:dTDP-4-dehydrorhamnose reductase